MCSLFPYIHVHGISFFVFSVNLDLNSDNEYDALIGISISFHYLNEQGRNDDSKDSVLE